MSESPWAPPVSPSSSLSAVALSAVKLSVASANCGPSSRSAGSARSAPSTKQTPPAATERAGGMPTPSLVDGDAGRVGAEAEEGRLGEVHLPEVADGDVEADEQDAVDGEQREQAERVGVVHRERDRGEEREQQRSRRRGRGGAASSHGGLRPSG